MKKLQTLVAYESYVNASRVFPRKEKKVENTNNFVFFLRMRKDYARVSAL